MGYDKICQIKIFEIKNKLKQKIKLRVNRQKLHKGVLKNSLHKI
jgi:hypothetical protein